MGAFQYGKLYAKLNKTVIDKHTAGNLRNAFGSLYSQRVIIITGQPAPTMNLTEQNSGVVGLLVHICYGERVYTIIISG